MSEVPWGEQLADAEVGLTEEWMDVEDGVEL